MRKIPFLLLFYFSLVSYAQDNGTLLLESGLPEHYLDIKVDHEDRIYELAAHYSIDHVTFNPHESCYDVRIWLSKKDYARFVDRGISFSFSAPEHSKSRIAMAKNFRVLSADWDRYPTYQAYEEAMSHFQHAYPDLCRMDTIMASTPSGHKILAARIGRNGTTGLHKPSVFYSASIHGDEVVGCYVLLRLIDHILTHPDDPVIRRILDEVDLWICPLENPDGTYHSGDHIVGLSPVSTRGNSEGYDLNRSYPRIDGGVTASYPSETEAVMDFTEKHHFVMSLSLHSGAEVYNYPWDTYTSFRKIHPDHQWWNTIGRKLVDTCRKSDPKYFNAARNGVTPGGNWYVITGSRQDFMTYYRRCREATLEISYPKIADRQQLPQYWENLKNALLNYALEPLYGIQGKVSDALTDEPIEARIFVVGHDDIAQHSEVYSSLPHGTYHRPLLPGQYAVTVSSEGYISHTEEITVHAGETTPLSVALERGTGLTENRVITIRLYPNPVADQLYLLVTDPRWLNSRVLLYNAEGKIVCSERISGHTTTLPFNDYPPGLYLIEVKNNTGDNFTNKILKR